MILRKIVNTVKPKPDQLIWKFQICLNPDENCFEIVPRDKKTSKSEGLLFLVPNTFKVRVRDELIPMNSKFEFLRILVSHNLIKKPLLFNLSYCPHKQMYISFLQDFAKMIDKASIFKSKIILMGDIKLNYLTKSEKQILIPFYALTVLKYSISRFLLATATTTSV